MNVNTASWKDGDILKLRLKLTDSKTPITPVEVYTFRYTFYRGKINDPMYLGWSCQDGYWIDPTKSAVDKDEFIQEDAF